MEVIKWERLEKGNINFSTGTGISTGSFDGFHKGHRTLLMELVQNCKKYNFIPGVVTFTRPLPSYKHNNNYSGDICSLNQRLEYLNELGIEFVILVEFNEDFASLTGREFFSKLIEYCNLKYIAEGIDFRCGYKGATGCEQIKQFALEKNIITSFTQPVYDVVNGEKLHRISSSYIREKIKNGEILNVNALLNRNYGIEVSVTDCSFSENALLINKSVLLQTIPKNGSYICKTSLNEDEISVEIRDFELLIKSSSFIKLIGNLTYEKFVIYFQKPGD